MAENPIVTLGPEDWMSGIRTGDFTSAQNGLFSADRHVASALYRPDSYQGLLRPPNGIYDVANNGIKNTITASTTRDIGTMTQLFQISHNGDIFQSTTDLITEPFYNVRSAVNEAVLDVSAQDIDPFGLTFNNDGSKLFVVGSQNNSIYEYTLTTNYDITTASYSSVSLSVGTEDTKPKDVTFNNDGSKLFVLGNQNNFIYEYTLTTNYDITTASYSTNSFDISGQTTTPNGMGWNGDGSKLFVVGNADILYQYTLTTNYTITTASYSNITLSLDTGTGEPQDITFNNDGSKLFVLGGQNDNIFEYALSTNYDITTASFTHKNTVKNEDKFPQGMAWNNDGSKLFMVGRDTDTVYQYDMNLNTRLNNGLFDSSNGIAIYKPKNGTEYLYYMHGAKIGRWDLSGIYPTGWTDNWYSTDIEYTYEMPMYSFQDRVYFANGSFVGFIGDNGAGDVEVNPKALDLPSKYHITSFSDDGRRLIIAATRQEQSGEVTSHAGSKIFFWDTNSDSWNKAWELDQSSGIASIRTVRGVTYALDTLSLYRFSFSTPPEDIVQFQPDETSIGLKEFSSHTSFRPSGIKGVSNHQKMIAHREGVMWLNESNNLTFYGRYTSEQPKDVLDVMWGSYPGANIISSTTGRGFTVSGTGAYQTDEYDFSRITINANKSTEWIDLKNRYDITSIEVVFGYDLNSNDKLELRVADEDNVFQLYGTIDFATYGSKKRVRLFGAMPKVDSLKLDFKFVSGKPYVQKVLIYGDKLDS